MKKLLGCLLAMTMLLAGCSSENTELSDYTQAKVGVIQLMQHPALDASYEGFKDVLVEAGISEDNIDYQVAGDQANCQSVADKLVNDGNNLIYAIATPALQSVAAATTTIPTIGCAVTDYESIGLVNSNDNPGGNVSGASDLTPIENQFDLLTKLLPNAKKVAILYCGSEDNSIFQGKIALECAQKLNLEAKVYTVADSNDIQAVSEKICNDGNDVVYIPTDNLLATYVSSVEAITTQNKIPLIVGEEGMVENGGFATYGLSYYNLGRKAGEQALAILKGEKNVAETPIAYLDKEDCALVINMKVAQACGIEVDKAAFPDAKFVE